MVVFPATLATALRSRSIPADLIVALVFVSIYALAVYSFQYDYAFDESDGYRVLIGMLDGAVSGTGIASRLHYDNTFGFGYLKAFYVAVDPATLRDPDRLTNLINQIGFWFMVAALLCFWCAVSTLHGRRIATIALVIFGLGPMILELGTSGHPVIAMFFFLCSGATLLLLPLTGWPAVLAAFAGAILLLAALTTRVDAVFAFPWLVLARADARSLRGLVVSSARRSIAPMGAIIAFLILQHIVVPHQMGSVVGEFIGRFLSLSHIAVGLVYMALGCGIATAVAAISALVWLIWRAYPRADGRSRTELTEILGPLALVVPELLFFVASPGPTRHFMLAYAGFSIILATTLTNALTLPRWAALSIAVLLAGVSQLLAEAVRRPLLAANAATSPYVPIWTGYATATHAPVGWVWQRHNALAERRVLWNAEGNLLTKPCQTHTVVLTDDETAQLSSRLYALGVPVEAHREGFDDIRAVVGGKEGTVILYIAKPARWPNELGGPGLGGSKL